MLLTVEETESGDSHEVPDTEPGPAQFDHFHCDLDVARLNQPSITTLPGEVRHDLQDSTRRTLREVLDEVGTLPSDHAIRIFLATFKAMHRVNGIEGSISTEHILVDSDGSIEIVNRGTEQLSNHEDEVPALGGLLFEMLTGKPPSDGTAQGEVSSLAPSRLRQIIDRSLGRDPKNPYATAKDLVRNVKREERAQFCKAILIPIVLFGFTLLLYVAQRK